MFSPLDVPLQWVSDRLAELGTLSGVESAVADLSSRISMQGTPGSGIATPTSAFRGTPDMLPPHVASDVPPMEHFHDSLSHFEVFSINYLKLFF